MPPPPRLPFLVFLPFSRVSRPSVRQRSEVHGKKKKTVAAVSSFPLIPSHSDPPSVGSPSLFLAGQRLMDIHSNEVKAINNSGGNAHPHLVPFLLKSSVCNKRSSHVNALLARSLARSLARECEDEREKGGDTGSRGVCVRAREGRRERRRSERRERRARLKVKEKKTRRRRGREKQRERERRRGTGRYAPRNILEYLRNLVAGH